MKLVTLVLAVVALALAATVLPWPRRAAVTASEVATANVGTPAGPGLVSIEDFLADYLGERWAELKDRIRCDETFNLDQLVHPSDVPAWDEVAPLIRQHLHELLLGHCDSWVRNYVEPGADFDPEGPRLNPARKRLSAEQRRAIEELVARYDPQITALGMQAFNLLVLADGAMWDEGRIEACPFVWIDVGDPRQRKGNAAILQRYAHGVWRVSYVIDSSEWPELESLVGEILALRHEREHAVAAYIEGL